MLVASNQISVWRLLRLVVVCALVFLYVYIYHVMTTRPSKSSQPLERWVNSKDTALLSTSANHKHRTTQENSDDVLEYEEGVAKEAHALILKNEQQNSSPVTQTHNVVVQATQDAALPLAEDLEFFDKHSKVLKFDLFQLVRDYYLPLDRSLIGKSRNSTDNATKFISEIKKYSVTSWLNQHNIHWTISQLGNYSKEVYLPPPMELPKQRFPQAIIIGVGKCGTRALIEFLGMHPNIVTTGPEVHFFDVDENFQQGMSWYRAKMPLSYSNQVTLEKTPSYIWSERAITEIYKMDRDIKLIVILKDPVIRIMSQAARNKEGEGKAVRYRKEDLMGEELPNAIKRGMYVHYLKMWFNYFPKSQIHFIESRDLIEDPATEIQAIESFLGIPRLITEKNFVFNATKGFFCMRPFHSTEVQCLGEGKGVPHGEMEPETEKQLYAFYKPYNEELYSLLGRRFDWKPRPSDEPKTDV